MGSVRIWCSLAITVMDSLRERFIGLAAAFGLFLAAFLCPHFGHTVSTVILVPSCLRWVIMRVSHFGQNSMGAHRVFCLNVSLYLLKVSFLVVHWSVGFLVLFWCVLLFV